MLNFFFVFCYFLLEGVQKEKGRQKARRKQKPGNDVVTVSINGSRAYKLEKIKSRDVIFFVSSTLKEKAGNVGEE